MVVKPKSHSLTLILLMSTKLDEFGFLLTHFACQQDKSSDFDMNKRNAKKKLLIKFHLKRIYSEIAF